MFLDFEPSFSLVLDNLSPDQVVKRLRQQGIVHITTHVTVSGQQDLSTQP